MNFNKTLKILTWNMYQAPQMWGRATRLKQIQRELLNIVSQQHPTIICLQEVHIYRLGRIGNWLYSKGFPFFSSSYEWFNNFINFTTELIMMLENRWFAVHTYGIADQTIATLYDQLTIEHGYEGLISPILENEYMNNGLAVFSKLPIHEQHIYNFPSDTIILPGIVILRCEIGNRSIYLINVHLICSLNDTYFLHRFVKYYRCFFGYHTNNLTHEGFIQLNSILSNLYTKDPNGVFFIVGDFNINYQTPYYTTFIQMFQEIQGDQLQLTNFYELFSFTTSCENFSEENKFDIMIPYTQYDQEHIDYMFYVDTHPPSSHQLTEYTIYPINMTYSDHSMIISTFEVS